MEDMKSRWAVILGIALAGLLSASTDANAQKKTAKECSGEWQANKADNLAKGITERAYVTQCRAGTPSSSATPASPPTAASPAATPTAAPPTARSAPPATTPTGANQFAAEGQAKAHCPSDTVVWANLSSKVYHFSG